ncbi:hypothetical protein KX01_288 [Francisella frigiditurris]|uniref:Transglutaminase-like superfamily protein n=2 Tax=Francisella frigiditurris TaxID=1542390 RepID=A0A1J0KRT4_9GAMM|nr:hypothetical protein KX01_288 [Francisella frigiditurris]
MHAIGVSLINTIREYISFSTNLPTISNNFSTDKSFKIYEDLIDSTRDKYNDRYNTDEYAKAILSNKLGYCLELSILLTFISQYINLDTMGERLYLTVVETNCHIFIVMHQNVTIHQDKTLLKMTEKQFINYDNVGNAIILDPWIYSVIPLKNYNNILKVAENLNVDDDYSTGKKLFFALYNYSKIFGSQKETNDAKITHLIKTFNNYYYISKFSYPEKYDNYKIQEEYIFRTQYETLIDSIILLFKLILDEVYPNSFCILHKTHEYMVKTKQHKITISRLKIIRVFNSFFYICFISKLIDYSKLFKILMFNRFAFEDLVDVPLIKELRIRLNTRHSINSLNESILDLVTSIQDIKIIYESELKFLTSY